MTERLYYTDSYLRHFTARITGRADEGRTVYLDRTAFYPTSGGQPFDTGSIAGVAVLDEDERIAHKLAGVLEAGVVEARPWKPRPSSAPSIFTWARRAPPSISKAAAWTLALFLRPSEAPSRWSSRIGLKAEE